MNVIYLSVLAALFTQSGYFFWKIAADQKTSSLIKNKKWILGLVSTIVGWLLFVKATNIGEISLIEPLMSAGDLFLILLAVLFLKERLTKAEWLGVFITVLGAIMLSSGGINNRHDNMNWTRLSHFIELFLLIHIFLGFIVYKKIKLELTLALIVGLNFGMGAVLTELMTGYLTSKSYSLSTFHFFYNPIFPFMMGANLISLYTIQLAFQKGRASVIVPIQLSIASALSVIGGAMVFNETIPLVRIMGIILIVMGSILISNQHKP